MPTEDAGEFKPGDWNTLTIELDDGHYTLPSLEHQIAKKIYEESAKHPDAYDKTLDQYVPGKGSLWADMAVFSQAHPEDSTAWVKSTTTIPAATNFPVKEILYTTERSVA